MVLSRSDGVKQIREARFDFPSGDYAARGVAGLKQLVAKPIAWDGREHVVCVPAQGVSNNRWVACNYLNALDSQFTPVNFMPIIQRVVSNWHSLYNLLGQATRQSYLVS